MQLLVTTQLEVASTFTVTGNFNYLNTRGRYVQKGSNTSGLMLGTLRTPPNFDNRQYLDPVSGLHRTRSTWSAASDSEGVG